MVARSHQVPLALTLARSPTRVRRVMWPAHAQINFQDSANICDVNKDFVPYSGGEQVLRAASRSSCNLQYLATVSSDSK